MEKTRKVYRVILIILFFLMILFALFNDIFEFYKVPETSRTEKRKLAVRPVFNPGKLDPYPKAYVKYFDDHFPFRDDIALFNAMISFFVFHQSPLPDEIELGKQGWLFYDQKESVVYQGKFRLAGWQVSRLVSELHQRAEMYGKRGIKFYVAFPPMKPEIYPEFLPGTFIRTEEGTVTDKIVEAIKKDTVIQYVDLRKAMLDAKPRNRLYALTDNHWNWMGAYYGYSAIMERIREDFPSIKELGWSDVNFRMTRRPSGNLAYMIGLSDYIKEDEYVPDIKDRKARQLDVVHPKPDWAQEIDNFEIVWSTGDSSKPVAVVICDSFTNVMAPFLNESFDTVTYIFDGWRYNRNEEIVDDVKPDIVLLIIFEPHISHLIGL